MTKKSKKSDLKEIPNYIGIRLKPIHQALIKELMIKYQVNSISDIVKQLILDSGFVARERNKRIKETQVLINNYGIRNFELTFPKL